MKHKPSRVVRQFLRNPYTVPSTEDYVSGVSYDGRFTLSYVLADGDESAVRVVPQFAEDLCDALARDPDRWEEMP